MTMHRYHPTDDDDPEATLYDDCERCTEHAEWLITLDENNTRILWDKMLRWENLIQGDSYGPKSRTEQNAMQRMSYFGMVLRNLGVDPADLPGASLMRSRT